MLSGKHFCFEDAGEGKTFDDCMYQKLGNISIKEVGCTVPWLIDRSMICNQQTKAKKAFEVYQKNRRNQDDICLTPCHFSNMYFSPQVTGDYKEGLGWAVFYFRRDVKTTREYYLYSFSTMAAEIGAYVGLLLGASLLNLASILHYLIELLLKFRSHFNIKRVKKIEPGRS